MCRFWQIFVEAREEFPIVFIQSRNSASTHEYWPNKDTLCCLATSGQKWRAQAVSEMGCRYQLILVPPTGLRLDYVQIFRFSKLLNRHIKV